MRVAGKEVKGRRQEAGVNQGLIAKFSSVIKKDEEARWRTAKGTNIYG